MDPEVGRWMGRDSLLLLSGDGPIPEPLGLPIWRPFEESGPEGLAGLEAPGRGPGIGPELPPPGRGRSLLPRFEG